MIKMYKKEAPTNFGFGSIMDKLKGTKLGGAVTDKIGKLGGGIMDKLGIVGGQGGGEGSQGINAKLDAILSKVGGGDGTQAQAAAGVGDGSMIQKAAAENPQIASAVEAAKAGAATEEVSPLGMSQNAFMSTHMQHPYSNNTGGKSPTFKKDAAMRMMAVADPNTKTSGLMFDDPEKKSLISSGDVSVSSEDPINHKSKSKLSLTSKPIKLGKNAKIDFTGGIVKTDKSGYNSSYSPSVKAKLKINIPTKKQSKPKFT
jgi:hypothetical protein